MTLLLSAPLVNILFNPAGRHKVCVVKVEYISSLRKGFGVALLDDTIKTKSWLKNILFTRLCSLFVIPC